MVLVLCGNMAAGALRNRVESAYIAWAILRANQPSSGANVVSRAAIRRVLRPFFSDAYIRQLIREGMPTFFHEIPGDRFELHGAARVATAIGAERRNMWRTRIGVEHLRTRADRRAVLFAAAVPVGSLISQSTLTAITGMSAGTIRRILGRARHVVAEAQWATLATVIKYVLPEFRAELARQGVTMRHGVLVKRLPNAHRIKHERLRCGRRSRQLFADLPRLDDAPGARQRTYFESYKQLGNAGTTWTDDVRDLKYVRWPKQRHGIGWEAA